MRDIAVNRIDMVNRARNLIACAEGTVADAAPLPGGDSLPVGAAKVREAEVGHVGVHVLVLFDEASSLCWV